MRFAKYQIALLVIAALIIGSLLGSVIQRSMTDTTTPSSCIEALDERQLLADSVGTVMGLYQELRSAQEPPANWRENHDEQLTQVWNNLLLVSSSDSEMECRRTQ